MIRKLQNQKILKRLKLNRLMPMRKQPLPLVQINQLLQRDVAIRIKQVAAHRALIRSKIFSLINLVFGLPQQCGRLFFK